MKFGAPKPWVLTIWEMVLKTGWTYDYIEGLSLETIHEYVQVMDGMAKAKH